MADTLLIVRNADQERNWTHFERNEASEVFNTYFESAFFCEIINGNFAVRLFNGSKFTAYNFSNIRLRDDFNGTTGTEYTPTSETDLVNWLKTRDYTAFFYSSSSGGSVVLQAGTGVTITGDGSTGNPYVISSTGGGGGIQTITSGSGNVTIDDTDPLNPIISVSGGSGYDSLQAMYDADPNKLFVFTDLNALGLPEVYTGFLDATNAQATLAIKTDDNVNFRGEVETGDSSGNAATLNGTGSLGLRSNGSFTSTLKADNLSANRTNQQPDAPGTYAVSASNGLLTATTDTEGNLDLSGLIVGGSSVTSVNGQTGVVSLAGSDIPNTPAGNIAATNVQDAINELDSKKQPTITGAATTITGSNLTANRAVISNGSGKVAVSSVTDTELGYVSGVTSSIQTQINAKGSGTVTSVTSSDATTATVATGTTTPVITVVSAPKLQTARTIGTTTGDATSSGSTFDGTANNSNALTLATVNSNVGTFGSATQVAQVTVNGKGLATAASNVAIQIAESQVTNLVTDLAAKAPLASPALTGAPTAPTAAANTNNTQLATTAFIQSALSGYERIVSKSATQSTAVTATTSETITLSVLIPAGTYSVGDFMNINAPLTKTGTAGTCLFKMYINTVASIPAGTQQVGQMNLTGSNISSGFSRRFAFLSGGLVNCYPPTQNSASDDAGASALARSSTIVASTTADMYIVITATPSSVSDTSRIDNYVITKY